MVEVENISGMHLGLYSFNWLDILVVCKERRIKTTLGFRVLGRRVFLPVVGHALLNAG